jgi:hypothetical protein
MHSNTRGKKPPVFKQVNWFATDHLFMAVPHRFYLCS